MAAKRRPSGARKSFIDVDATDSFKRFTKSLARTPADMERAERAFYMASARTVQGMAQSEATSLGSVAAKSAKDVRTAKADTVVYGGQGYSMGAEFGSYRYKQFKTWRGNKEDAGYFLWPSIRLFRDKKFLDLWQKEVWRVVRSDFVGR